MPPANPTIELILFDIDGTLLLPKGAGRASMRLAMLDVFGTAGHIGEYEFGGKTDWLMLNDLLTPEGFSEDEIRRRLGDYEAAIARHMAQLIGGYPVTACVGALDVIHELRRRQTPLIGVLTGNVATTAPIKLRAGGFDPDWFVVGAYGGEHADRNVLPFLARERAERLLGRSIAPGQVMIIGDTPADVACARALGAVAVAVLTGYFDREALAATQPDYLLDDLTTFFEIMLDRG